jgi:hypothetical protein
MRSRLAVAIAVLAALATSGCLLPNGGTPVLVDSRAGRFWSGKGLLIEVSPDQKRCKVAIRDRALIVHRMWVDCWMVHPRGSRD